MIEYDMAFPKAWSLKVQAQNIKQPLIKGVIKSLPTDFRVDEVNKTPLSGAGEHLWVLIEKIGENTEWVARLLADIAEVPVRNVGFAGLKDRHAQTSQWFSVQLPKANFLEHLTEQLPHSLKVIKNQWHNKKLKRGNLAGNEFSIIVRGLNSDLDDQSLLKSLQEKVDTIAEKGVPNYFGMQRFGHEMGNINAAEEWFKNIRKVKKRHLKSLLLSSARSWIFNHILAKRVENSNWDTYVEGDLFQLDGSHSWFNDPTDAQIQQRLISGDIHPTGALWGNQAVQSHGYLAQLEQQVADQFPQLVEGVSLRIAQQDRRALRVIPRKMDIQLMEDNVVKLRFFLPAGSFATSVLREIVDFNVA